MVYLQNLVKIFAIVVGIGIGVSGFSSRVISRPFYIGIICSGETSIGKSAIQTDFAFGPFETGLDFNAYYFPKGHFPPASTFSGVLLRKLVYKASNTTQVGWQAIDGLSAGSRLLLNQYGTTGFGPFELTSQKLALMGSMDVGDWTVSGFNTQTHVTGLRISRPILPGLGKIVAGLTLVSDTDGPAQYPTGEPLSGAAFDFTYPISSRLTIQSESATLAGYGSGHAVDGTYQLNDNMTIRVGARLITPHFVPGMWNLLYENAHQPTLALMSQSQTGWSAGIGFSLGESGSFEVNTEIYSGGSNQTSGKITVDLPANTKGMIEYGSRMGEPDGVAPSSLVVAIQSSVLPPVDIAFQFRRDFQAKTEDHYTAGMSVDLVDIFPIFMQLR